MQRAPCWRRRLSSMWKWNSRQSWMRSSGVRSTGSSRRYSMNPVGFPMMKSIPAHAREVAHVFFKRGHDGLVARQTLVVRLLDAGQPALIVLGHDFHELRNPQLPRIQQPPRAPTAGELPMPLDQLVQLLDVRGILDTGHRHHLLADVATAVALLIEHVGDTAGHAGGEVAAGGSEHHDATPGHVLTTVITHTFDHGSDATVAHREALPGHAAEVG